MPSAEETTYLIEVMPDTTTQNFLARDVDLLVSQIKENLRLSGFKAKSSVSLQKSRPSPYRIPSRSWADPASCEICCSGIRSSDKGQDHHHRHHLSLNYHRKQTAQREEDQDDPYELLQELLREGGLIKEAVKRLQANLDELEDSDYQRKPYFYDSEDEPRPPVFPPIEL